VPALILPATEIEEAAATMRAGGVVAVPAETAYGLCALPGDPAAVRKLFAAVKRTPDAVLPVLLADGADLPRVAANISPPARRLIERCWPGPLTLILRRAPGFRPAGDPDDDRVAVRVPADARLRALIQATGGAVAMTAAVGPDGVPLLSAATVAKRLGRRLALILDGDELSGGPLSTVLDCSRDRPSLVREGALTRVELEKVALTRFGPLR
jgi:L-threonylcarbamoyladenylate synthase